MSFVLTVVCTDRGAHRRLVLGELLLQGDGIGPQSVGLWARNRPRVIDGEFSVIPPEERPNAGEQHQRKDGGRWFTFTCPNCGRAPRLRDDALIQATYTDESGKLRWRVSQLDICHWPS